MKFTGIDPGTRYVGYAIVDESGALDDCGEVNLTDGVPNDLTAPQALMWRFKKLHTWAIGFFNDAVELRDWNRVGIEAPWVGKNAQTALKLGKAWGLIAGSAMRWGLKVYDISPKEAKSALTGTSNASKQSMITNAELQFGLTVGEHAADAIGVALACRKKWIEKTTN